MSSIPEKEQTTEPQAQRLPRIGRTLPPVHVPLTFGALAGGVAALWRGGAVERFEGELRDYFQVPYARTVSSGKAALVLVLRAMARLHPGRDEVLIPAYTCYSVPSAVVAAGLKVRLCDLDAESLDLDRHELERQLENERLLAVVTIHLYGIPAAVKAVLELAAPKGVFVIEDAAQAMGAETEGALLGTAGDVGIFSMGRGKAFSTVEGGVVLTGDSRIGDALEREYARLGSSAALHSLRLLLYALALIILSHPRIFWLPRALPFLGLGRTLFDPHFPVCRLSRFQAGLTRGWQGRLARLRLARCRNIRELLGLGITMAGTAAGATEAIRFPVLVPDREERQRILAASDAEGLGISPGYPASLDRLGQLAGHRSDSCSCPVARRTAAQLITLPVHPLVKAGDLKRIGEVMNGIPARAPALPAGDFMRLGLLVALWLLTFAPLYPELVREWLDNSDNSHAFLVPFISLFLAWQGRHRIARAAAGSSLAGGVLLGTSLAVYVAGYAGGSAFPARVAMVASLAGLLWLCLGGQRMRGLAFPVAFLLFMVPIPYSLLNLVAGRLQLIATAISEKLILGCSIPVYREGNMLYFVQTQLEVAEACSGIRSIVSLTMISLVFCFLSRRGWWRKAALVAAAAPIAIVANIVRVSGTGVLAHFYGDRVARGFLHEFSGIVIFLFGFALLFALFQTINGRGADDPA